MSAKTFETAWNGAIIQMDLVSRANSLYLLQNNFVNRIQDEQKNVLGSDEVNVFEDLALLFRLYFIEKEDREFLELS